MKNIIQVMALTLILTSSISIASDEFYKAVKNGDIDVVKSLISQGQNVNQRYGYFNSPVIFFTVGSSGENIDILKLLIENGADIGLTDNDNQTILHKASQFASSEYVQYLLEEGAAPNKVDNDKVYPLFKACAEARLEVAKLLIQSGADVNKVTGGLTFGYSPLIAATYKNSPELVEYLLSKGADKSYKSPDGTALQIAKKQGNEEIINLLD